MSFCPKCGEALVLGWAYCQGCGASTAASALPSPVGAQPASHETQLAAAAVGPTPVADEWPASSSSSPEPVADPAGSEDDAPSAGDTLTDDAAETSVLPGLVAGAVESTPEQSQGRRRQVLIALGAVCALAALVVTTLHILGTHDRLNRTRTNLASTRATLEDTRADLSATKGELSETKSDLTTRTSERDALQGELDITKSNLSDARGKVDLQASVIEDLRYCLDGVAEAMVDLADGYWSSAIYALDRVEPACKRASNSVV